MRNALWILVGSVALLGCEGVGREDSALWRGQMCGDEGQSCDDDRDCCSGECVIDDDAGVDEDDDHECDRHGHHHRRGREAHHNRGHHGHGHGHHGHHTRRGVCACVPVAEICGNGSDDDCDGIVDDGCVCAPGSSEPCYDGPLGTADVGACRGGTTTCNAAGTSRGPCVGQITPIDETCGDGIDQNCDGFVDELCVCVPGSTASCYEGPDGTDGVGMCADGVMTCNGAGTDYGACVGAIIPTEEVCGDGLDNDCDGTSDDGCVCAAGSSMPCYGGPAGSEGVGACAAGMAVCNATGTGYGACTGDVTPIAEVCGDLLDNDCDGVADDGCVCEPASTRSCNGPLFPGVGVCVLGTQTCNATGTAYSACVGYGLPRSTSDFCGNGLDDDCDGHVDEQCVGDRVWEDIDGDGIQDPGEPGVPGVTLRLRNASSGTLVLTRVTDAAGWYSFPGVPLGSYRVEVVVPVGYALTTMDAGGDDTLDSDFDPVSNAAPTFILNPAIAITHFDCGLVRVAGP